MTRILFAPFASALLLAAIGIAAPASAHHSFAMYDPDKLQTITGTVQDFEWTNPHAVIWLVANRPDGQAPDRWSVELPTSPGNLTRMGWTKHSLRPGDRVAIALNPLRDGRHGGSLKKVTLLDTGQVLTASGTTPVASIGK
jgi:hypothetical protein